eukprot:SAG11_NODE_3873_length_2177_cov_1.751684_3_plen_155_part_00
MHTLEHKNIKAYAGLELMRLFKKQLATMLQLHGGLIDKLNYEINCVMVKYLDGELIAEDTRWVNSTMRTISNSSLIDTKIMQAMQQIQQVQQAIPELDPRGPTQTGWYTIDNSYAACVVASTWVAACVVVSTRAAACCCGSADQSGRPEFSSCY